jgi:hypothetical protein
VGLMPLSEWRVTSLDSLEYGPELVEWAEEER